MTYLKADQAKAKNEPVTSFSPVTRCLMNMDAATKERTLLLSSLHSYTFLHQLQLLKNNDYCNLWGSKLGAGKQAHGLSFSDVDCHNDTQHKNIILSPAPGAYYLYQSL